MAPSFPSTIKAIGINKYGDLDVIEQLELPFPAQNENEVVIKVEYAGVNYIDTYERAGIYPAAHFPKVLGQEVSGQIVALPTSSKTLDDPEYKLRGLSLGDNVAVLHPGVFAEYVSIPWFKAAKLPANVDARDGAAAALQGLTALAFSKEAYEIKKGDTVLIYSAAGGVGLILTQLAVSIGATVIGTVSSDAKAQVVKGLGAQHVINTSKSNVVDEVLRITNGDGVDGIFDGVGKDTFEDDFKVAKRKGTIVTYGNASGIVPPFAPLRLADKDIKIVRPKLQNYLYTPTESRTYTTELYTLVAQGAIKLQIHKEYPFNVEGVREAQKDLTSRGTIGKLLLKLD